MKAQLLSTIENSRNYTIAIATAMPESSFHFKPSADVFTFCELLNHISYGIHWSKENYIKRSKSAWAPVAGKNEKEDVISYLNDSFDSLKQLLELTNLNDEVIHGVYATLDHITHHRGQATIYLRAIGITPPEYSF
jgi:hypothetical protein